MNEKNIARQAASDAIAGRYIDEGEYDEFVDYIVETAEELDFKSLAAGDAKTLTEFIEDCFGKKGE